MSIVDRDQVAAELHAFADAVAAGTAPVPALQTVIDVNGNRLRILPRAVHNVICRWRVASPQDADPNVLGCAGCGFCYPREGGEQR